VHGFPSSQPAGAQDTRRIEVVGKRVETVVVVICGSGPRPVVVVLLVAPIVTAEVVAPGGVLVVVGRGNVAVVEDGRVAVVVGGTVTEVRVSVVVGRVRVAVVTVTVIVGSGTVRVVVGSGRAIASPAAMASTTTKCTLPRRAGITIERATFQCVA